MRYLIYCAAIIIAGANLVFVFWKPQEKLLWNRTQSAPTGLYWLSDGPYNRGDWVIVSANSDAAKWAQSEGFIGGDWPLIKRVYGMPGDEICRDSTTISFSDRIVAEAKLQDLQDRKLPSWSGCHTIQADEVFLLNVHPDSLDGRYFGPTNMSDLMGRAHKVSLF